MSLSDLRKLSLLRPETEWTGQPPRSRVNGVAALTMALMGIAGCVLMVFGDGAMATWLGVAIFGIALVGFTLVNVRAIAARREVRDGAHETSESAPDGES